MNASTLSEPEIHRLAADYRARRELIGIVSSIPFYDAGSGYVVVRLRDGSDATGEIGDPSEIQTGSAYRFMGRWIDTPRRGWQFRFDMVVPDAPADRRGIVAYLARELRGVGMTEAVARRAWDVYGVEAVEILRTDPSRVATDGLLSAWQAGEAAAQLRKLAAWERTKIDLFTLFAGRGFPKATIRAACEHRRLGVRAADLIRRDPYTMLVANLPGVGFRRADKLYIDLGHDPTRLKRQLLAAWSALREDNDGHTWHPAGALRKGIMSAVGLAASRFDDAIRLGIRARWLATRIDAADRSTWYTEAGKARDERTIAVELARLMKCPARLWPTVPAEYAEDFIGPDPCPLIPSQRAAVRSIGGGPVAILTGSPGTGKTFVAAWLLGVIRHRIGKDRIAVCAPTGKAAVRITEMMARAGLDVHEATTIHRLLEIGRNGHDGRGWGFQRNAKLPLDVSLVVADEQSMTDVPLMAALLQAIPDGCHVLIIGDVGQLPPVGHGCPLRDMIRGGIPTAELTEIKRNAGLIVDACRAIAAGKKFRAIDRFDAERPEDNLRWIEAGDPAEALDALRQIIVGIQAGGRYDPTWDVQVLCALNEASPVSRRPLNEMLQGILNPAGDATSDDATATQIFRRGDKIICLRNHFNVVYTTYADADATLVESYLADRGPTAPHEVFVANGDVGRVLAVNANHAVVRFLWPDRVVRIDAKKSKRDDASGDEAAGDAAGDFVLAYAVTTHKSQGSEFPIVIVMVDDAAGMVAKREFYLTAFSRGRFRTICIGRRKTCDKHCRDAALPKRRTFLAELIRGEPSHPAPAPTVAAAQTTPAIDWLGTL